MDSAFIPSVLQLRRDITGENKLATAWQQKGLIEREPWLVFVFALLQNYVRVEEVKYANKNPSIHKCQ